MLIDNETFFLLKNTLNKFGWLHLPSRGNSMYPLIREGDVCRFIYCDTSNIKKGDVILYCSSRGELIAHRFFQTKRINDRLYFLLKGDTNLGFDEPIEARRIIGKLLYIQRKKTQIYMTDIKVYLWEKGVVNMPLLSVFLRIYLNRRSIR